MMSIRCQSPPSPDDRISDVGFGVDVTAAEPIGALRSLDRWPDSVFEDVVRTVLAIHCLQR